MDEFTTSEHFPIIDKRLRQFIFWNSKCYHKSSDISLSYCTQEFLFGLILYDKNQTSDFSFILNLPRKLRRFLASLKESAVAFYYFVINFVSLKPTGVLVPSESFPIKGITQSSHCCDAVMQPCANVIQRFVYSEHYCTQILANSLSIKPNPESDV